MLLTELGLQGHNRTPWAWGWQSVNPYNPAPEPRPKAVPAEQLARAAGMARGAGLVNRKDVDEAVRLALQAATTHSPPTPPPPPASKRSDGSDSFKTHRSMGCGPSRRIICPHWHESISYSNTSHKKKCPNKTSRILLKLELVITYLEYKCNM